jgi:hypothetical protein
MDARLNALADWPTEGASLAEVIGRIAGPELLAECRAARAAVPPYSWAFEKDRLWPVWWLDKSGEYQSRKMAEDLVTLAKEAMRACLAPVINAWNAGEIRATGKRRDVLASDVDIPAPADLWVMSGVDLERSSIDDPVGGKIFDLRFHVEEAQSAVSSKASQWIESNVMDLRRSPPGGVPPKSRAGMARLLRARMEKEYRQGKVKLLELGTIINYLRDHDLWP